MAVPTISVIFSIFLLSYGMLASQNIVVLLRVKQKYLFFGFLDNFHQVLEAHDTVLFVLASYFGGNLVPVVKELVKN